MDSIPDATTVAFFRERLRKAGLIEEIFEHFEQHLRDEGYEARGGQIIDSWRPLKRCKSPGTPPRRSRGGVRSSGDRLSR